MNRNLLMDNLITPGRCINLVRGHSYFERTKRDPKLQIAWVPGLSLADYRAIYMPQDTSWIVSLNGRVIPDDQFAHVYPHPGHEIVFIPRPEDGKTLMMIGTMLAVAAEIVFMPAAMPFSLGAGMGFSSATIAMTTMATMAAGTLAANMLFPVQTPGQPANIPFYGFNTQTAQRQGDPIPRWYGYNKLFGNVVDNYTGVIVIINRGGETDMQTLNVLIDLGMGPFNSISNVKINDQPIAAFSDVSYAYNLGYMRQTPLPGFSVTKSQYPVVTEIFCASGPYTYTTNGNSFDALEIDISWPDGMWGSNDDGYFPNEAAFTIRVLDMNGTQVWTSGEQSFIACRSSNITQTYGCSVPAHGRYQIVISKSTTDHYNGQPDATWNWGDAMYFTAVREVYWKDLTYPRRAQVAISALATGQLSGSLRFSCYAECLLIRTTADGVNWTVQYSNNPAWVAFDILTQPVYDNALNVLRYDGKDPSELNVGAFLACAQYCDEIMPDGTKRITFNGGFTSETDPWTAANHVLGLARSRLVHNGIQYTVVTDKARTSQQMFTMADIKPDSYKKIWLPLTSRASKIEGTNFKDASNDFIDQPVAEYNPNVLSKFITTSIDLMGITLWAEMWRYLNYHLAYNQYLLCQHTFKVDAEAIVAMIGDVVDLQDEITPMGASGKLVSGTTNTVTLDQEVTIDSSGNTYMVAVRHSATGLVEKMVVTNGPGTYTTLSVSGTFVQTPAYLDAFAFGKQNIYLRQVQITDKETNADQETTITAIDYNPSIYGVDYNIPAVPTNAAITQDTLPAVTGPTCKEMPIVDSTGGASDYIDVYWSNPISPYYAGADIWYQVAGGIWTHAGTAAVPASTFRLPITQGGAYTFAVCTINPAGQRIALADAPSVSVTALGKTTPPPNITNFSVSQNGNMVVASWDAPLGFNVVSYEIRYNPRGDATWADGTTVTSAEAGSHLVSAKVGPGAWTFMICARDIWGNYSAIPAACDLTITNSNVLVAGGTSEAAKGWPGLYADLGIGAQFEPGTQLEAGSQLEDLVSLTYGFVLHPTGVLIPKSQGLAVDAGWDAFNLAANPVPLCVYTTLELDLPFDVLCRAHGEISSALVPGSIGGTANPQLQIETKLSESSYEGFVPWGVGDVTCQAALMQIVEDTSKGVALIRDFTPTLDAELRTVNFTNQAIAVGGTAISYDMPFVLMPNVEATPTGSVAILAVISNETVNGCTVTLYNPATGASVAGNANITIKGV